MLFLLIEKYREIDYNKMKLAAALNMGLPTRAPKKVESEYVHPDAF